MTQELTPFGYQIAKDGHGKISLTDLWRSAGSPDGKEVWRWTETQEAKAFIDASCKILNLAKNEVIAIKRGKSGGSFGHKQVALEYAQYLSPELAYAVNQMFFERLEEEKNPDLTLDRAIDGYKKKGKSEKWISERLKGKATRLSFTKTLSEHGVKGTGFKDCTNAIYQPLWGGNASLVRTKKGLPEKSNTREAMNEVELAAVGLAELLSQQNIENNNIFGNTKCMAECLRTSNIVAQAVKHSQKNL